MTVKNGDVTFQAITRLEDTCEVFPASQTITLGNLRSGLSGGGTPSDHFEQKRTYYHEQGTGPQAGRRTLSVCWAPGDDGRVDPVDAGP
jgi:hypothetical protein